MTRVICSIIAVAGMGGLLITESPWQAGLYATIVLASLYGLVNGKIPAGLHGWLHDRPGGEK